MKLQPVCGLLCVLTLIVGSLVVGSGAEAKMRVYFGTYTTGKSRGIYSSEFDPVSSKLGEPELAVETKSPSFLAVHPNRRVAYAGGGKSCIWGEKGGGGGGLRVGGESGKSPFRTQK